MRGLYFKGILYLFYLLLVSFLIYGDVPSNQNIEGFVFNNDTLGVENGIPVIVNNTNLNEVFITEVFAPPIPTLKGAYSLTIQGSNNDLLLVRSYNDTHYGEAYHTITSLTSKINVTLNKTRNSELNISITNPLNNDNFELGSLFNVTVKVDALVLDATNCIATIDISNSSVMNVTGSLSENLGTITIGSSVFVDFEVESLSPGKSDIFVLVNCSNDDIYFQGKNRDFVSNITVSSTVLPVVNLINPENETNEKTDNLISFDYNVSEAHSLSECRLYINNSLNQTDTSVTLNSFLTFDVSLDNGVYDWRIECETPFSQVGTSETRLLFVSVYVPNITEISLPDDLFLNAGSTRPVSCLVTIEDENGADDILDVNATFYLNGSTQGVDNESIHYTNSSCGLISTSGNVADYNCSFDIWYYAKNGTWICNVTAVDLQGLIQNSYNSTNVDTLYAINLSSLLLDYGEVSMGDISEELGVNISNLGNQEFELSVRGYGGSNPVSGDGFAMICDSNNNISISNLKYGLFEELLFQDKSALTSLDVLTGLNVPLLQSKNIFWQLEVPPIPVSECTGTIVFTASVP